MIIQEPDDNLVVDILNGQALLAASMSVWCSALAIGHPGLTVIP